MHQKHKRGFWSLLLVLSVAPLCLITGGCITVLTGTVTSDINESGDIEVRAGDIVRWRGASRINAAGDITIRGRLEGEIDSCDLTLYSRNGSITIMGTVQAAPGGNGQRAFNQRPIATAGIATNGGNVTILAAAGGITRGRFAPAKADTEDRRSPGLVHQPNGIGNLTKRRDRWQRVSDRGR